MQFAAIFEDVRRTERVLSIEFAVRFALVVICCGLGWWFLDLSFLPAWIVAYYLCVALEKYVSRQPLGPNPTRGFLRLWGVSFLLCSVYSALPVYVWSLEDAVYRFGAIILLVGGALNIFLLRSRSWALGTAYLIPYVVAVYWIAATLYAAPYGGAQFWTAMILSTALAIYFAVALFEADRSNRELNATRAQFVQAQKVEAIGMLTSGVAHDFNNLLSVIQGNLELLKAYPDAPDRAVFLDEALMAAQRGAQLTKQLNAHGRQGQPAPRRLDPCVVLRNLEEVATRVLPANIALHLDCVPDQSTIMIDETTLQSALLNLVINARDAMPNGGRISITVHDPATPPEAVNLIQSRGYVAFEVRDTGDGIPEEIIEQVREPFFSTKPEGQGSGLGLAMVSGFALQSGGDLDIQSTLGVGTRVTLYLPRATL